MQKKRNEDGSTSYTFTESEKIYIMSCLAYFIGSYRGFNRGRRTMAKEIHKTGMPKP